MPIKEMTLNDEVRETLLPLITEYHNKLLKVKSNERFDLLGEALPDLTRIKVMSFLFNFSEMGWLAHSSLNLVYQTFDERLNFSPGIFTLFLNMGDEMLKLINLLEREDEAGFFINSQGSVISGPDLAAKPDFTKLEKALKQRQIYDDIRNLLRPLSVGTEGESSHTIRIPQQITRRHDLHNYLYLISIDLNQYDRLALCELLPILEQNGSLLLQGPLQIPLQSLKTRGSINPYFLLLDTEEKPADFLANNKIKGKVVRILKKPEAALPTRQIIKVEQPVPVVTAPMVPPPLAEPVEHQEPQVIVKEIEVIKEVVKEIPYTPPEVLEHWEEALRRLPEPGEEEEEEDLEALKLRARKGIRFSIGFKLILIISLIIIGSLSGMIALASWFFLDDSTKRVEESNQNTAALISQITKANLDTQMNSASILLLGQNDPASEAAREYQNLFFKNAPSLVYVGIPELNRDFYNSDFMSSNNVSGEFIGSIFNDYEEQITRAKEGERIVYNVSAYFTKPVILMAGPYRQGAEVQAMVLLVNTADLLMKSVESTGIETSFIVNGEGDLLAHKNSQLVINGESFADMQIVQAMQESPVTSGQNKYVVMEIDEEQEVPEGEEPVREEIKYMGAYSKISFGGLGIITTVREDLAFEAVYKILRNNILITIMVLSLAILIVYFYSKTMTTPITKLVVAAKQIEGGQYSLGLEAKSHDEIGVLTDAIIDMSGGLAEKEKMKDAFGRFVNEEIAEQAMKGEIKLGGEIKETTIFFSDIRSFTAISEKLEPDEVVGFLNDYMTRMVECVEKSNGFVDKYIGDAIMAVWGAPISYGNDAENAINGSLMMRRSLMQFNRGRGGDKKPIIKIGCGLNSGPVLSGQIGSDKKMEYTVIGDAVNLASRIEALNKPMGTDLLISEETYKIVEGIFDVVPMNKIKVKGKTEPQQIYAVLGRMDDETRPKSLKELRELVGITGNFDQIADVEEKEVKYEIID